MFNRCDEKWKQSVIFRNILHPSFICPFLWLVLIWELLWFINGFQSFEKPIFWWIWHYKWLMIWLLTSDWHCLSYLQVDLTITKIWEFLCQFFSTVASVTLHSSHWRYIWIINFLLIVHLGDSFVSESQFYFWFSCILFFWSVDLTFSPVACFGSLRGTDFLNDCLGWRIHLRWRPWLRWRVDLRSRLKMFLLGITESNSWLGLAKALIILRTWYS